VIVVGFEEGKVLAPGVLALSKDDIFAVADAPGGLRAHPVFQPHRDPARRLPFADARGAAACDRPVDSERRRLHVVHGHDLSC
jgi:hypothetical protein